MAFAPQAENMAPDVVREAWPHDGPYLQVKGGLGNSERRLCWLGRFLLFGFLKRNGLEGGYIESQHLAMFRRISVHRHRPLELSRPWVRLRGRRVALGGAPELRVVVQRAAVKRHEADRR